MAGLRAMSHLQRPRGGLQADCETPGSSCEDVAALMWGSWDLGSFGGCVTGIGVRGPGIPVGRGEPAPACRALHSDMRSPHSMSKAPASCALCPVPGTLSFQYLST